MNEDLKYIKEKYGIEMMTLCEELFPQILKIPNLLPQLIESNFAHSKFLYEDIIKYNQKENFKIYIYGLLEETDTDKTPEELFEEAGYTLYKYESINDLRQIAKYYHPYKIVRKESEKKYVFYAVKKNITKMAVPYRLRHREDECGRSLLCITFTEGSVNNLEIISRYGYGIENYNFAYYNNLENIIPGLTKSFEHKYKLNINQNGKGEFELPGYIKANDGRYYKYNYKSGNTYYCPNNIIIDNFDVITKYLDEERYILIDEYIIDLIEKKVSKYNNSYDGFTDTLDNIETIHIEKKEDNRILKITCQRKNYIEIEIDKTNSIIRYKNEKVKTINENFLGNNKTIKILELPNVTKIGDYCLISNNSLESIYAPNLIEVGSGCLKMNNTLKTLILPNLTTFGPDFLYFNVVLTNIETADTEAVINRSHFNDISKPKNSHK